MTAWVEIDRAALVGNARAVRGLLGDDTALCAVVKANAYGHGAVLSAGAFLEGGASRLAVTTVAEAAELRAGGVDAPILLLASHAPDEADAVVEQRLTAAVSDLDAARRLAAVASAAGGVADVHLLVDTGMGRDGCLPADAPALYAALRQLDGLRVEGVFTHFPNSIAADKGPTRRQLGAFEHVVAALEPRPAVVHAANSGAARDLPESRLDMVRVGTLLYGQYPSRHVGKVEGLREAWSLKASLVEVRHLPAGSAIGYGSEATLSRETRVGTLLIGWQHGFTLAPASLTTGLRGVAAMLRRRPPTVTVHGKPCPVLGRVSMQTCNVDLSAVPEAKVGDVATVPARRVTTDRGLPRVAV